MPGLKRTTGSATPWTSFFQRLSGLYASARIFAITPIWRDDPASLSAFGEDVSCMDKLIRDACAGLPNVSVVAGQSLVPHLPEFYSDRRLHPNDLGFGIYDQNLQRAIAATPPMTGCGCARLVWKNG